MTEERTPAQSALRFAFMTVTGIAVAFGLLGYARSARDAFRDSLVQKAVTHYEENAANADARENEFSLKKSALEKNEKSLEQIYRQQEQQLNQTRTNESAKLDKERRDIAQQRENILALRYNFNEKENKRAEEYKQREAKLREGLQQSFATKKNELYSLINSNLSAQYAHTSNELFAAWAKRQEEGRIEVEKVIESYKGKLNEVMQTYSSPFALTNISTSADASSFTSLERLLLFEKHFGATIDSFLAPTNTIYDAVIEGKIRVSASIYEEKLMRHLALIKRNATNNMLLSINLYKAEEKTPRKQFILTNIIAKNVTTQDIARANEIQKRVQEIQKKIKLEDSKWGAREGMLSDLISLKKEARELTNAFVSTLTTNIDNLSYSLSHVIASSTPERTLLFEKGE